MKEKAEKTKNQAKDILTFARFTVSFLFCLSIKVLAASAVYYALKHIDSTFWQVAVLICAVNTFMTGVYQLYKIVMEKK